MQSYAAFTLMRLFCFLTHPLPLLIYMVKFGTKDTSRGKKNGAIVNLEHYLRHDLAYFGPRCSIFLYTCKSEIILKKTHGKIIEFDFGIWLGRSKIIFVFQVTISKFFGSVGRKKKFFHEKKFML